MPKVSVVLTSYNLAPYLAEAVQSVLSQTFGDFELLIGDDASTDHSVQVLLGFDDPRIKLFLRPTNLGANQNANALLEHITGEYVCFMSSDDVWLPHKLEKQLAYLESNPACGMVAGHAKMIGERGQEMLSPAIATMPNLPMSAWRELFKRGNCIFISTCMHRAELHSALGNFQEDLTLLADLDWNIRVAKNHDLHVLQEVMTKVRVRGMKNLSAPTQENLRKHAQELGIIQHKHFQPEVSKRMKLMLATPFYENKGYSPYIRSMFQTVYTLARHSTLEFDFQEVSGGSYIDHNRNMMADTFLKSDCTHLMFIDSDQSWDVEGFLRVLKSEKEVVGAAYPVKNNWEQYGVTVHTDANGIPDVDTDGLIRAEKVPTGFMKISRSVFDKIKAQNPDDWYYHGAGEKLQNYFGHLTVDHIRYGEDISFNIRWQRCGGDVWVEPRVSMGHYGSHGWYGNYDDFLRRQVGGDLADKTKQAAVAA